MHILHFGVVVKAPDYLTPDHARDVLAQALADAKNAAQGQLVHGIIDDQATMLAFSDFLVTEESPAKLRLDWTLHNPHMQVVGSDRTGWLVFDENGREYAAGPTAYAAIDAAIIREKKGI